MTRFCIVFITIIGFSACIKLNFTQYGNWATTIDTSDVALINQRSSCEYNNLSSKCGIDDINPLEQSVKSYCCSFWMLFDCMEKEANGCSNKDKILSNIKSNQDLTEKIICEDYKRDETICGLQWVILLILLIVIACIVFIAIVSGLGFCVYKKCKNRH